MFVAVSGVEPLSQPIRAPAYPTSYLGVSRAALMFTRGSGSEAASIILGNAFSIWLSRIIQILQFLNVELSERAITHGRISSSSFLGVPLWASSTGTDRSPCYSITPPQPVKPDTGDNSAHAIIAATGSSMEAELPNALAHDCYSNGKCLSFAWTGNITDKRRESTELPMF
jgi:hypothetical protein